MDVTTYVLLKQRLGGKADLIDGKIPAEELPSYVDDVIEYPDAEHFPATGEGSKIYVALDTGFTYRWSGSDYIQIGGQDLSDYYTKDETDAELETKQDVIEDLTDIRDGAEAGATAVQPEDTLTPSDINRIWNTELPVKGDIISMNLDGTNRQFRVLSIDNGAAKVIGMFNSSTTQVYNKPTKTVVFEGFKKNLQQYQDSDLDHYLNETWYNTLNNAAKNAIIPQDRTQYIWEIDNSGDPDYTAVTGTSETYTLSKIYGWSHIGMRNVFALSVQEVLDYLGTEPFGTITAAEIWQAFWNDNVSHPDEPFRLASARSKNKWDVFGINGKGGCIALYFNDSEMCVRPAFVIDLDQIDFTIVED